MKKLFIGIDNGVTGTIGVISDNFVEIHKTPTKKVVKYTKKKANLTRLDHFKFKELLENFISKSNVDRKDQIIVSLERPMVNPKRFTATSSALRIFEATLVILEQLELPYIYIDSKEWQKSLLPKGIKGSTELKLASKSVGKRLFPHLRDFKHPDFDGILITEYTRKTYQ